MGPVVTIGEKIKIILKLRNETQDVLVPVIKKSRPMVNKRLNDNARWNGTGLQPVLDYLKMDFDDFMGAENEEDLGCLVKGQSIHEKEVSKDLERSLTKLFSEDVLDKYRFLEQIVSAAKRAVENNWTETKLINYIIGQGELEKVALSDYTQKKANKAS